MNKKLSVEEIELLLKKCNVNYNLEYFYDDNDNEIGYYIEIPGQEMHFWKEEETDS